jgi:hypothetical protein
MASIGVQFVPPRGRNVMEIPRILGPGRDASPGPWMEEASAMMCMILAIGKDLVLFMAVIASEAGLTDMLY